MMNNSSENETWLPVIGRALAYLSLSAANMADKNTAEKARFLEGLGLARKDVAAMLGTTPAVVTEVLRRSKKKRSGRRPRGGNKAK